MVRQIVAKATEFPVTANLTFFRNSACSKIIFLAIWILLYLMRLCIWKGNTKNQDDIRLVLRISSSLNDQEEYHQRYDQLLYLFFQGLYLHELTYRVLSIFYNISGPHSATICMYIPLYTSEYSHKVNSDDSHHNY